jgi:hypothetical protein
MSGGSLFGEGLDCLARERGAWPNDAMVFMVEVIGVGDNPQVLVSGGVPIGTHKNGRPKFDHRGKTYKAAVLLSEYRETFKP